MQLSLSQFVAGREPWRIVEERIARFVELVKPRWLYVYFSGGKDSAAVLGAALRVTTRIVAVYLHIAGQTHRLNLEAAKSVAEVLGIPFVSLGRVDRSAVRGMVERIVAEHGTPLMLHIVTVDYYTGLPFWEAVRVHGLPIPAERGGRGHRWCCLNFRSKWLWQLPANGSWEGKRARIGVVGVRAGESWYRRRRYSGVMGGLPVNVFRSDDGAPNVNLAPLIDLSEADVWSMVRHYGLYDAVKKQYDTMGQSPNCVLCPLASRETLERTVRLLPTSMLLRVYGVISEQVREGRLGTLGIQVARKMLDVISHELKRRGVTSLGADEGGTRGPEDHKLQDRRGSPREPRLLCEA